MRSERTLDEIKLGVKIIRPVVLRVKAKEGDPNVRTFTISTDAEDRMGDVLEPRGVDLKAYKKNPVVMWAHDYYGMPIGRSVRVEVSDSEIEADVEFAPTDFAQQVKALIDAGFIKGSSVGFIPYEWEFRKKKDGENEIVVGFLFKKWGLLEWSVVPVPSNPEALVVDAKSKGIAVGAIEDAMREWKGQREAIAAPFEQEITQLKDALAEASTELAQLKAPRTPVAVEIQVDTEKRTWTVVTAGTREIVGEVEISPEFREILFSEEMAFLFNGKEMDFERFRVKIGAVLNRKNKERLTDAQAKIQEVLDSAEPAEDEEENEDGKTVVRLGEPATVIMIRDSQAQPNGGGSTTDQPIVKLPVSQEELADLVAKTTASVVAKLKGRVS